MFTGGSTVVILYVGLGHAMALTKNAHRLELFLLMYFLDMSETLLQVHRYIVANQCAQMAQTTYNCDINRSNYQQNSSQHHEMSYFS